MSFPDLSSWTLLSTDSMKTAELGCALMVRSTSSPGFTWSLLNVSDIWPVVSKTLGIVLKIFKQEFTLWSTTILFSILYLHFAEMNIIESNMFK